MKLGKSSNTVIQKLSEYDFAHGWPTRLQTLKMAFSRGASIGVCRRPETSPIVQLRFTNDRGLMGQ